MQIRTTLLAGLGTTALVVTTLATGAVSASGSARSHPSLLASGVGSSHGTAQVTPTGASPAGACQTKFGSELPTVDGIVAWNDGTGNGFDTAPAADVVCLHARKIGTVAAFGYFGTKTETFHVTFYGNDPANGTDEPNDNIVLCDYPALTGAAGGQYPHHVKTVLKLHPACKLPAGQNWVSIQNVDGAGPWYWEMQSDQTGGAAPDWADANDSFGSGCTVFDNDRYLVDCLGYTYGDWMLHLEGARHN